MDSWPQSAHHAPVLRAPQLGQFAIASAVGNELMSRSMNVRFDAETPVRAYRNGASRCWSASGKNLSTYARVGCQNADNSSNAAPMANAVIAKLRLTTPNCFNSALNANRT
jgi:hypothetical protein